MDRWTGKSEIDQPTRRLRFTGNTKWNLGLTHIGRFRTRQSDRITPRLYYLQFRKSEKSPRSSRKFAGWNRKFDQLGTFFNLTHAKITSLPSSIGNLANLKDLYLNDTINSKRLPDGIGALTNLEILSLWNSGITSLPTSICNLAKLKELLLFRTLQLKTLPDGIGALTNLECILLGGSGIVASLPGFSGHLKDDHLESIPDMHNLPVSFINLDFLSYSSISKIWRVFESCFLTAASLFFEAMVPIKKKFCSFHCWDVLVL